MGKIGDLLNVVGSGGPERSASQDDFVRWLASNEPKHPSVVGEELPAGIPTMASRYGTFGSKSLLTGEDSDPNKPPVCADAESQPPPPCAATGECTDLLKLAHRYEDSMKHASRLAAQALEALGAAKVLLRRVGKAAAVLVMMPQLSEYAPGHPNGPGGDPWTMKDQLARRIMGPIEDGWEKNPNAHNTYLLARWAERNDFDHRIVEYLQRAEDDRPLQLINLQGRMPMTEPMPKPDIPHFRGGRIVYEPASPLGARLSKDWSDEPKPVPGQAVPPSKPIFTPYVDRAEMALRAKQARLPLLMLAAERPQVCAPRQADQRRQQLKDFLSSSG